MNWNDLLCNERYVDYKKKSEKSNNNDPRSEFEKDYHRIITSSSFRRLQDKTQVFPLDQSDFIRTRLTHSIEVSSLGKSLAQSLARKLSERDTNLPNNFESDIVSILSCAGLLHDIGNPPFGHFCEYSIRQWFVDNLGKINYKINENEEKPISEILKKEMLNDLIYFEGNAQALRQVCKLHFLVNYNGMNLTMALLNTLIKYPISSNNIDSSKVSAKKFGYFYSEKDIFDKITAKTGTLNNRHPLTYLLEAADDIAYCTADIEDGFKKGKFTYDEFIDNLKDDPSPNKIYLKNLQYNLDKANNENYKNKYLYAIQNFLVFVQGNLIHNCINSFLNNYDKIMSGTFEGDLFSNDSSDFIVKKLKNIAYEFIFSSESIMQLEISSNKMINYFMDSFVNAVLYFNPSNDKMYEPKSHMNKRFISVLSETYKNCYIENSKNKTDDEKLYLRILLATDYICGMTDSFAKNLYQKLNAII
ncbi:MAG: deoxyguanosinetriphosphate triphosphohydrolase [Oscillospiraceae bacterium]